MQIDEKLTDRMLEKAIAACAEIYFAGDEHRVYQSLMRRQCDRCKCVSDALATEICDFLSKSDHAIKSIYRYDAHDVEPVNSSAGYGRSGIHLIAWVDRKSPDLRSLADALGSALSESKRKLGCPGANPDCLTLDLAMVDDRDVRERRGLGLFVKTPHLISQSIWSSTPSTNQYPGLHRGRRVRSQYELPEFFDPELISEARLLDHARNIENLPDEERAPLKHHLLELKVALIRRIISDQLDYINIARDWFSADDLADINERRLGFGRIGGKAGGMLLAGRILREVAEEDVKPSIQVPDSFFLGSDLMYIFMAMNGLMHWADQKYKSEEQIREEYPRLFEDCLAGDFPSEILKEIQSMLEEIGARPLIVRSSSQLEDSLGTTFADKYDSYFCPNQGTPEENLNQLTAAIAKTYASTFKPEALLYRRRRGLQDYDERMAVLIQVVQGETFRDYYFPFAAGVAFSQNLYRWTPHIRREEGFARMVWGLGTRSVERVGDDYPRLVALSHPTLQPDDEPQAILHYSQKYMDLIDLKANAFKTLPVSDVLTPQYPQLRNLIQLYQDGYLSTPHATITPAEIANTAITFEGMLSRSTFPAHMKRILGILEDQWNCPVDVEFTVRIPDANEANRNPVITVLQCRPLPRLQTTTHVRLPKNIQDQDVILRSHFVVPSGHIPRIDYVLYIEPSSYFALPDRDSRVKLTRAIGRLNAALEGHAFICIGPGRWGTANFDLGVYVRYADICNSRALVELSGQAIGPSPEPSFGTHFFHDLMEAQIFPISVDLDNAENRINEDFLSETPDRTGEWIELDKRLKGVLRLLAVKDFRPKHHVEIMMDDEKRFTLAFLTPHA